MAKVERDPLPVMIFTQHHRVQAVMHVSKASRLTDFLNVHKELVHFLPVTDAVFYSPTTGKILFKTKFASLNWVSVHAIVPLAELVHDTPPEP